MLIDANQGIIVTGAANGIGRATVKKALAWGARVFATDHLFADAFWEELDAASKSRLYTHEALLGSEASVAEMMQHGFASLGAQADSVIHCAGVYDVEPSDQCSEDRWNRVLDTNAKLSFLIA